MSSPLLLRAFVSERLTAAAEEIFRVFQRTIERYEEEASSSKQENQRLRALLLEVMSRQKTDLPQSPVYKEEPPLEQPEQSNNIQQEGPEHSHIKEEAPDHWTSQGEEEQEEFRDADILDTSRSSVCEHEETKPSSFEDNEYEEKPGAQTTQVISPLVSTPPPPPPPPPPQETPVQSQSIQDERECDRLAPGQMETQQSQSSLHTSRESSEFSHVNSRECQCYLCNKAFSSAQHLINHAFRMHSKDAGVLCAVCGQTLESTESLKIHLQSHKGSKACHMCGKQCTSMTSLTEHMASHAGVKLHRCHVCGKECSRKGDLKIHMRIHTGEKPFRCSFCCKSFTHSGHLRKHLRSHTGERPHRCNVCGRGFLQSAHLKYHLGTHTQKY